MVVLCENQSLFFVFFAFVPGLTLNSELLGGWWLRQNWIVFSVLL